MTNAAVLLFKPEDILSLIGSIAVVRQQEGPDQALALAAPK
ncbi:hypothetical protein [Salinibacter ruber]|jgi:hypothetical protein|nr:hypothetical protein [Salinibacter ruber]MCS4103169.1 hypothetical protein [Salinibacter ruber]